MFSNFYYNGKYSGNFDLLCVKFDSSNSIDKTNTFLSTDIELSGVGRSQKFYMTKSKNKEPISFTMQIIKTDGSVIDTDEQNDICDWLCDGKFHPFSIDEEGYEIFEYNAIFINPKLIQYGRTVGIEFEVKTDSVYTPTKVIEKELTFTSAGSKTIILVSANNEYIYPVLEVSATSAITSLDLQNKTDSTTRKTTLKNLASGEVVTIDNGKTMINTNKTHTIFTDFNKNWFRLINGSNEIYVSSPCKLTLKYRELRKVGMA